MRRVLGSCLLFMINKSAIRNQSAEKEERMGNRWAQCFVGWCANEFWARNWLIDFSSDFRQGQILYANVGRHRCRLYTDYMYCFSREWILAKLIVDCIRFDAYFVELIYVFFHLVVCLLIRWLMYSIENYGRLIFNSLGTCATFLLSKARLTKMLSR